MNELVKYDPSELISGKHPKVDKIEWIWDCNPVCSLDQFGTGRDWVRDRFMHLVVTMKTGEVLRFNKDTVTGEITVE